MMFYSLLAGLVEWEEPKSVLGLASYYRRFFPNFAQVAGPLHKLIEAHVNFAWTSECQLSFDMLKILMSTSQIHSRVCFRHQSWYWNCPKPGQEAGGRGGGGGEAFCCVWQPNFGLSCVTRKELLAVMDVGKYFRYYLQGPKFRIETDHAALRTLLKANEPEG